ncbi:hypothetical protein CMI47_17890 [Candidatus Pacearchaeota archaeon]|nr:hypothetical protein [Candidatus Pacearchaeota archaeon]
MAVVQAAQYDVIFDKEYLTAVHGSIAMAVADFARAWATRWQLKNRNPGEIEVRLAFLTGDTLNLRFQGRQIIDSLLQGNYAPLERALKRAGLSAGDQLASWAGGPLLGVQLAVPTLVALSQEEYAAGLRVRTKPFHKYTNKSHMQDFRATSRLMAERRAAEGPQEAFEQARRLAARTGEAVPTGLTVAGRPLRVVEVPGARVTRVVRPSGASVEVVRGPGGRFRSYFDDQTKAAIYQDARDRGFSRVARELGIPRSTIYEWKP